MPKKFIVGITIIVAGIAYFMFTGVSKGTAYYVTVKDLGMKGSELVGDRLRMGGLVEEGSIEKNVQTLDVRFRIYQEDVTIPVTYNGITPDMFKDGSEVIVEGVYDEDGVFEADVLLAKCPSKYESKEYEDTEETDDEAQGT